MIVFMVVAVKKSRGAHSENSKQLIKLLSVSKKFRVAKEVNKHPKKNKTEFATNRDRVLNPNVLMTEVK